MSEPQEKCIVCKEPFDLALNGWQVGRNSALILYSSETDPATLNSLIERVGLGKFERAPVCYKCLEGKEDK